MLHATHHPADQDDHANLDPAVDSPDHASADPPANEKLKDKPNAKTRKEKIGAIKEDYGFVAP